MPTYNMSAGPSRDFPAFMPTPEPLTMLFRGLGMDGSNRRGKNREDGETDYSKLVEKMLPGAFKSYVRGKSFVNSKYETDKLSIIAGATKEPTGNLDKYYSNPETLMKIKQAELDKQAGDIKYDQYLAVEEANKNLYLEQEKKGVYNRPYLYDNEGNIGLKVGNHDLKSGQDLKEYVLEDRSVGEEFPEYEDPAIDKLQAKLNEHLSKVQLDEYSEETTTVIPTNQLGTGQSYNKGQKITSKTYPQRKGNGDLDKYKAAYQNYLSEVQSDPILRRAYNASLMEEAIATKGIDKVTNENISEIENNKYKRELAMRLQQRGLYKTEMLYDLEGKSDLVDKYGNVPTNTLMKVGANELSYLTKEQNIFDDPSRKTISVINDELLKDPKVFDTHTNALNIALKAKTIAIKNIDGNIDTSKLFGGDVFAESIYNGVKNLVNSGLTGNELDKEANILVNNEVTKYVIKTADESTKKKIYEDQYKKSFKNTDEIDEEYMSTWDQFIGSFKRSWDRSYQHDGTNSGEKIRPVTYSDNDFKIDDIVRYGDVVTGVKASRNDWEMASTIKYTEPDKIQFWGTEYTVDQLYSGTKEETKRPVIVDLKTLYPTLPNGHSGARVYIVLPNTREIKKKLKMNVLIDNKTIEEKSINELGVDQLYTSGIAFDKLDIEKEPELKKYGYNNNDEVIRVPVIVNYDNMYWDGLMGKKGNLTVGDVEGATNYLNEKQTRSRLSNLNLSAE